MQQGDGERVGERIRDIGRPPQPVPGLDRVLPGVARLLPRAAWDALGLAIISVVAALIGLSGMWDVFRIPATPVDPWWSLVFALPGCVLVSLRERIPLTALLGATALFAADLVTAGGLGSLLVLLDVLWHAVHRASARVRRGIAIGIGVATAVVFVGTLVRVGDPGGTGVRVAVLLALAMGTVLGTDYWWAVAVGRAEELAELESRRAADDARETIRDEREVMARELHDVVAGHVSAIAIRTEAALSTPPDEERDRAALRAVRDASLDAHEALRSMISVLRDTGGALSAPPRLADIPALVRAGEESGLRIRHTDALAGPVAEPVGQAATGVVREALTNCVRHAAGAAVEVLLAGDAERITVRVESRGGTGGTGPALAGSGTGLATIATRIRALGGDFSAGPVADGWSVRATLPRKEPG
ncbi:MULTISPECIES: sensor histidine kinase [unclassified Microbacterium]|uniref:sensor histidine kinase n=1 Tax=unclassified Microbacterium TaxID=2609290 RepID=UPI0030104093